MYQVCPGVRTPTPRITKFIILVKAFLLYITMHLVSLRRVVVKKIFENWSLLGSFCPTPKGARDLKFTIYVPLVPKMLHAKEEGTLSI